MTEEKTLLNELRLINIALRRGMSAFCDGGAKPSVSGMVLHFIFMKGGSVLQKDVEIEFEMRRSTVSEMLGKLEREGYIIRTVNGADSRSKRIELSQKTIAEQKEISQKFMQMEKFLDSALSEKEKATFFELSNKIRSKFESVHD